MRGSPTADVEIRRRAVDTLAFFREEAPHLFGDMQIVPNADDTRVVETPHGKV